MGERENEKGLETNPFPSQGHGSRSLLKAGQKIKINYFNELIIKPFYQNYHRLGGIRSGEVDAVEVEGFGKL